MTARSSRRLGCVVRGLAASGWSTPTRICWPILTDWVEPATRGDPECPRVVRRCDTEVRCSSRTLSYSAVLAVSGTRQPFPARDAQTKQRPFPHRRLCCPTGSSSTTAASDAHPARLHFPGSPVIGTDTPTALAGCRAGEGLPSSRRHRLNVPHPIRRRVLHGCTSRYFTASMAFTLIPGARHSLSPPAGGPLTTPQASLYATDRSVAPPKGLSTLGFDPTRFQTEPPACYRASWQLPGPDSHRQATTSFAIRSPHGSPPACWAHETSRLTPGVPTRIRRCTGRWCRWRDGRGCGGCGRSASWSLGRRDGRSLGRLVGVRRRSALSPVKWRSMCGVNGTPVRSRSRSTSWATAW